MPTTDIERRRNDLMGNDAVWARFYRDGKSLGEVCTEFGCRVYELLPWITDPVVRAAMQLQTQQTVSGWHTHDGESDPDVDGSTLVQVCFRDGSFAYGVVHDWDQNWQWAETGRSEPGAIIAWRVHAPPAQVQKLGEKT